MLVEAILYDKLSEDAVRCALCLRRCRIEPGGSGYCLTRTNIDGILYSTIYGEVAALHIAPIEMKPVYHYLPGSHALSLGAPGCNFLCPGCQNWELSFALKEKRKTPRDVTAMSPEKVVSHALMAGCRGLSWTYTEPTLWLEYTIDTAKLAKGSARGSGLYTNYVTNGAMTPEALDAIGPLLDVFRVDIKGFSRKTYERITGFSQWEGILHNTLRAKNHWKMHVELVTNLIPGVNDDRGEIDDLVRWIRDELGSETPWHITRFFPRWRTKGNRQTSVAELDEIYERARAQGLSYVYVGNVPGHRGMDTYCPGCGCLVIERKSDGVQRTGVRCTLENGRCPRCGSAIPGRFD